MQTELNRATLHHATLCARAAASCAVLLGALSLSALPAHAAQSVPTAAVANDTNDTDRTNDAAAPAVSAVVGFYQKGQFQDAAAQGLNDLLREPWNHELRFMVADSLQRTGQLDDAIAQFEALDGTPLAASASLRLNALRANDPNAKAARALRRPPDAPTQVAQRDNQYVVPEKLVPPSKTREKPASSLRARVVFPKRTAAVQQLFDLSAAGDYETLGVKGLALLAREKQDDEVRLMIANSLAWSGHLDDAAAQYQTLTDGPFATDASVGLANTYRWRGRDDSALPLYQRVLAVDPKHAGALEGLNLAKRELRPRTLVTFNGSDDSSEAKRRGIAVNQRWRDSSGNHVFEVETGAINDRILNTVADQRDLTLRYQALALPLQPLFELNGQSGPSRQVFGGLRLHFAGSQNYFALDHLNWGKQAANANALQADLNANHAGLSIAKSGALGEFNARVDYYDISDGNQIASTGLRFAPSWRPLGSHIKLFTGTETRDARKAAVNNSYWSPVGGFGTLFVGVQGDWGAADWNLFGAGQAGVHVYGESGFNWSLSAGGKRWLSNDVAFGLSLWRLSSSRDNASYRAKALTMSLEKLWN
jgi:tetratricopeptide (TPR) repeat protein